MKITSQIVSVLVVSVVLCLASQAVAAVIFQDDFEGYDASSTWPNPAADMDPGTPPVGEPWTILENADDRAQVLDVPSGTNSSPGPHGGTKYLHAFSSGSVAPVSVSNQTLIEQNGNATLDMWVYKNSADGWDGLVTVGAYDGEIHLSQGRSFLLYWREGGSLQYFDSGLFDTGLTFTADTWMHLIVEADYVNHTYDVTLDGDKVTGLPFDTNASKLSYVYLSGGADITGNWRGAFDDIVLTTVPEPSAGVLLTCGLLACVYRKRR